MYFLFKRLLLNNKFASDVTIIFAVGGGVNKLKNSKVRSLCDTLKFILVHLHEKIRAVCDNFLLFYGGVKVAENFAA